MNDEQTTYTPLEAAEQTATQLNDENAQLRARLAELESGERPSEHELVTAEELRRRHGNELFGILAGPNTGGGTLR